jgi:hypothetical protein
VETLLSETADKLALHFKICTIFVSIADKNQAALNCQPKQESLGPLYQIRKLLRLKDLKDKLLRLIREADNILVDRKQTNLNNMAQSRYLLDEPIERFNNQDLFDPKEKYDEEEFLDRCD